MNILAIETSCDETALAIVKASGGLAAPKFQVIKSEISSQVKIHGPFGGVVPNLAKREHLKNLPLLFKNIFKNFKVGGIDLIAVTAGPGLEPALWAGIEFAKNLAKKIKKPLVGANHLEGHLYSFLLPRENKSPNSKREIKKHKLGFPAVALIVSGGHTILLLLKNIKDWKKLGETRDDAAGEAFDKVARLLRLPYPGGPEIEKIAKMGRADAINFPRPMMRDKNYDFSFSGLKTSVLYFLKDNRKAKTADVAASFQKAVVDVLTYKTIRAAKEFRAKSVFLSGGVAANKKLRQNLERESKKIGAVFFAPDFKYNTDNAAMIAAAAYLRREKTKKGFPLAAKGNLNI